jgi:hypothetical protein
MNCLDSVSLIIKFSVGPLKEPIGNTRRADFELSPLQNKPIGQLLLFLHLKTEIRKC